MRIIYALLIHFGVMMVCFDLSLRLLGNRPARKGQASSLATSLAGISIGVLYFIFRSPNFFFVGSSQERTDRIAFVYLLGGVVFAAHFLYLTLKRSNK